MGELDNNFRTKWAKGSLWEMAKHAQVITLIGAGGKTTCLQILTQEIHAAGYPVIATTTTKVYPDNQARPWRHANPPPFKSQGIYFWYTGEEQGSGKWLGNSPSMVDKAVWRDGENLISHENGSAYRRYWIIEGDGARERRLKCWASHEPQIPRSSDCGVLILDGRLWGQELKDEDIHRSEYCPYLVHSQFTEENAWRYLGKSPVFYPQYQHLAWVIFFNIPRRPVHGLSIQAESSEGAYFSGLSVPEPEVLLDALYRKGAEEMRFKGEAKPRSLRLAAGDAKGGELQWFDLW